MNSGVMHVSRLIPGCGDECADVRLLATIVGSKFLEERGMAWRGVEVALRGVEWRVVAWRVVEWSGVA